jgi:hypothetical protein
VCESKVMCIKWRIRTSQPVYLIDTFLYITHMFAEVKFKNYKISAEVYYYLGQGEIEI